MKKAFLRKVISAGLLIAALSTVAPLGVSAANATSIQTTGWTQNSNGSWSYASNSGKKQRGWLIINGTKYYFDNNGNMRTGWISYQGRKYFADINGAIQTGVLKIDGKVYYFNSLGVMQTGRVRIGNKVYMFSRTGQAIGKDLPTVKKEFDSEGNLINNKSDNDSSGNNNGTGNITNPDNNGSSDNGTGSITKPDNNGSSSNGTGSIIKPDNNGSGSITNPDNNGSSDNTTGDVIKPGDNQGTDSSGNGSSTNVSGLPALPEKYPISVQADAETKILELMNQKRVEAGLKPLTMDNTLLEVARYKSNHMIQNNYFSHTNPDGTKWTNWLKTIGYKYSAAAENIAYNSYDPVQLFNQWWNSSGHRQNMMNPSYTKVGIGVVYGNNKYMGTQEFSN